MLWRIIEKSKPFIQYTDDNSSFGQHVPLRGNLGYILNLHCSGNKEILKEDRTSL